MFILKGQKEPVQRVEFSADGTTLLSVDARRNVRLWDLETRATRWALEGSFFAAVTLTPDGRHVLTCINKLARIDRGEVVYEFDRPNPVELHDVRTGGASPAPLLYGSHSGVEDLAFSPSGTRCVAKDRSPSSRLLWWEYPSGRPLPTWDVEPRNTRGFAAMTFSLDGRTLAGMNRSAVQFFDVASGELRFVYPFQIRQSAGLLAFHPGGRRLAVGSGRQLVVLDIESREEVADLRTPKKYFRDAAFTRDGRYLATVSNEETVKFWDTSSWRVAHEYAWEVGGLRCIAFDRDGFRGAAAGTGKKIVVWDLDD